ncbi:MAG: molybdopterin-guanine dinucleotide biosynthesis protein B [Promethearchaeati archaeon SRVP18_Atabeyarchaeia-1]
MEKPRVICIVGPGRHVGKTAVLTEILKEMKARKLSVGTVKHIGERSSFKLTAGKDTTKHLEAGSDVTLAVTSSEIIAIRRDIPLTLESALSQMPGELDYVLAEGFRRSQYPKIVVTNSESEDLRGIAGEIIALVVDHRNIVRGGGAGEASRFDVGYLVELILEYFKNHH